MSIEFGCPCGKTLRVRDELAGDRVKCPVCGEIRNVPLESTAVDIDDIADAKTSAKSAKQRQKRHDDDAQTIDDVRGVRTASPIPPPEGHSILGRPVNTMFRMEIPSMLGHSVLRVDGVKLIEETQQAGSFRHSEFHLNDVTGADIRVTRNRGLLMCGLMTLPIGIGLIPLVAFFLVRYRFMTVYLSSTNKLTISIQSLEEEAYAFLDLLLNNAQRDAPAVHDTNKNSPEPSSV
jgi:hypothetical protein